MHYFNDVITKHYFDFKGRARRAEFWYFVLFNIIFAVLIGIIAGALSAGLGKDLSFLGNIYALAVFFPSLAVAVRRMHDIGKSGWWVLLQFVPTVSFICFIIFGFLMMMSISSESSIFWALALFILAIISIIALIWFIVLAVRDSQPGENKWGRNPKEPELKAQAEEREVAKKIGLD